LAQKAFIRLSWYREASLLNRDLLVGLFMALVSAGGQQIISRIMVPSLGFQHDIQAVI